MPDFACVERALCPGILIEKSERKVRSHTKGLGFPAFEFPKNEFHALSLQSAGTRTGNPNFSL